MMPARRSGARFTDRSHAVKILMCLKAASSEIQVRTCLPVDARATLHTYDDLMGLIYKRGNGHEREVIFVGLFVNIRVFIAR